MGIGLLALGQMPKSQGMAGLMGLLASQDAAAKNKADSAWQEEARGRQRKEWSRRMPKARWRRSSSSLPSQGLRH
jgi:ribosomal 30S subunit maturation factor RimM